MSEPVYARVPFQMLPDDAEIFGKANRSGGVDARGDKNDDIVVYDFVWQLVGDVRKELARLGNIHEWIDVEAIEFWGQDAVSSD